MIILVVTAVLLSGSLTGAQENHIRNFQVVSQNTTHITFSWEVSPDYLSTINNSHYSYFYLRFEYKSLYTSSLYIEESKTTHNGSTFTYTSPFEAFYVNNYYTKYHSGEFIMWIELAVYNYTYYGSTASEHLYVKFGQLEAVFEFKVHLWPSQTCFEFVDTANYYSYYYYSPTTVLDLALKEVRWLLLQSCQCALPYDFTASIGYFTCAPSDYVVFRVRFPIPSDPPLNLTALTEGLARTLTRSGRSVQITILGGGYFISPGPCGLTVPALDSPHCFYDSADVEETPTQLVMPTSHQDQMMAACTTAAVTAAPTTTSATPTATSATPTTTSADPATMSTAPTTMPADPAKIPASPTTMTAIRTTTSATPTAMTVTPTADGSAQPVVIAQDNSAVVAIVVITCVVTLVLALSACILVVILFMRVRRMAHKEPALSRMHWHTGVPEDTSLVVSDVHQADSISQQALVVPNKSAAADDKV